MILEASQRNMVSLRANTRRKRGCINMSFGDTVMFRAIFLLPLIFMVVHANWHYGMFDDQLIESDIHNRRPYENQKPKKIQTADNNQHITDIG